MISDVLSGAFPFTVVLSFMFFNLCFVSFLFLRRSFHGRRLLLLYSIISLAALITTTLTSSDAEAQQIHTVTVYVTVIRTMLVQVPVTAYVPVTSVVTSLVTVATTKVSTFVSTTTNWKTATIVTTAMGIFGPTPNAVFGPYSDVGVMGIGGVVGAALTSLFLKLTVRPRRGGVPRFPGHVVEALNEQDQRNQDLLDQVISAADETAEADAGGITFGGKEASLEGTGGVALLEYAKDKIQTAASNISGVGTQETASRKIAERKMRDTEGQEDEGNEEEEDE